MVEMKENLANPSEMNSIIFAVCANKARQTMLRTSRLTLEIIIKVILDVMRKIEESETQHSQRIEPGHNHTTCAVIVVCPVAIVQ